MGASKITDHVYVGDLEDAVKIARQNPKFVIISVVGHRMKEEPAEAIQFSLYDPQDRDKSCAMHKKHFYDHTVKEIRECLPYERSNTKYAGWDEFKANRKRFELLYEVVRTLEQKGIDVFIHCLGGIERGPAFLAYYVHRKDKVPLDVAYDQVKERHPKTEFCYEFFWNSIKKDIY